MANTRKIKAQRHQAAVVTNGLTDSSSPRRRPAAPAAPAAPARPVEAAKLPPPLRFPLLVIINLSLSAFLYSLASEVTGYELAPVSRSLNESWQVLALVGWKVVELAVGWYGNFDGTFCFDFRRECHNYSIFRSKLCSFHLHLMRALSFLRALITTSKLRNRAKQYNLSTPDVDLVSLTILSHFPIFYLLSTFYLISARTTAVCLAIDVVTTALPFRLLRPRNPTHTSHPPRSLVPNRDIIHDLPVRAATSLLAAAVYTTTLIAAYRSWLPAHLVVHFDGLKSLAAAYEVELPRLLLTMLPAGWAAREFLFTPAMGGVNASDGDDGDEDLLGLSATGVVPFLTKAFDPVTATLSETARHNLRFWAGWDERTRTLIQRTATLALFVGANVFVQTYGTLEGAGPWGALGWAAVWSFAAVVTGFAFAWVGDV